jgi:hypothetical protein
MSLAKKYSSELSHWQQGIAHFLEVESSLLNSLFQRQSNVLRLAYAHALILVHRPFLLSNFTDFARRDYSSRAMSTDTEEHVMECLKAAMSIVLIVNDMCEGRQIYKAFWVSKAFNVQFIILI